jgi:hypothetical protein
MTVAACSSPWASVSAVKPAMSAKTKVAGSAGISGQSEVRGQTPLRVGEDKDVSHRGALARLTARFGLERPG